MGDLTATEQVADLANAFAESFAQQALILFPAINQKNLEQALPKQ